ncbi:MAG: ATP-binding protein [Planctomycetes bacterium]|nr:ATP-binding protein [Planctomycetota bacterium]
MASSAGELVVLSGPYRGRRYPIRKERLKLGRDPTCDIQLEDEATSRVHAELVVENGTLSVQDNGSTNGTYVNDARVKRADLKNGDRVSIGDTVFQLQVARLSSRRSPQVVFSEETKGASTRMTLSLDDTHYLDLKDTANIEELHRHFTKLYEFIVEISGILHRPAMLERVLDLVFKTFEADRAVLLLLTPSGDPGEKVVKVRDGLDQGEEIAISRTMAHQLLEKKESFLSYDAERDIRLQASESMQRMNVKSVMGVPLMLKDRILGLLYIDRIMAVKQYNELDLKLFTAMATQASIYIATSTLYSELLDAAEFNNSLLRSLASGLMVVDRFERIVRVNNAALDLFKKDEAALINRPLGDLPELSELRRVVEKTLATGEPQDRFEVRVVAGDEKIPIGLNTTMLTDHTGATIGVVANFRNLAHIRRLEAELRRSQNLAALGQMAAGVAHEIRNPLNSIRGFTQLIQEAAKSGQIEPGKLGEFSAIVLDEVDRMNRIVQDLLDFSRQRDLTLIPTDLTKLMQSLVTEMGPDIKKAEVEVAIDAGEVPPPNVLGNHDKLRQVFRNILLNAIQASKAGQKVKVVLREQEAATLAPKGAAGDADPVRRRSVSVRIEDQGVGIDEEDLGSIFDPFFTKKDVGTGLGLSITQKIVDQHGGRIQVESKKGEGAVFTVFLPAA